MKYILLLFLFFEVVSCTRTSNATAKINKPINELKSPILVDEFFNNMENGKGINWLKEQSTMTQSKFESLPEFKRIYEIIEASRKEQHENIYRSVKVFDSKIIYYLKKKTVEDKFKLYTLNRNTQEESLLFDPKEIDSSSNISYYNPSWDGMKIAIGTAKQGQEISKVHIVDLSSRKTSYSVVDQTWPSALGGITWLPDNSGFFYTYIPVILKTHPDYLKNSIARLCQLTSGSVLIKDVFSKKMFPKLDMPSDAYPICYVGSSRSKHIVCQVATTNQFRDGYLIKVDSLNQKNVGAWKKIWSKDDEIASFKVLENDLYYSSSKDNSNFELKKTSLINKEFTEEELIVSHPSLVLSGFSFYKGGLTYSLTKNGVFSKLFYYSENGESTEIITPAEFGVLQPKSTIKPVENIWFTSQSWLRKNKTYSYNLSAESITPLKLSNIKSTGIDESNYIVQELEVTGHDDELIPLSIIYKKGLKLNSSNPTMIYAYGAYGYTLSPTFFRWSQPWWDRGGVLAFAHVRGGGEKGNRWYKGGFKKTKANSWKDFISCSQYLITEKYTSNERLIAQGGSAGGIVIGRAITDRPDLYSAAIIHVGTLNTTRMEFHSGGKGSIHEFGTMEDSLEAKYLYEMDSFEHIEKGVSYPGAYVTAGFHDMRVPYWIPSKFAAKLQAYSSSNKSVLLDVDFNEGHGANLSEDKTNLLSAKILAFAFWQSGHPDYQPKVN